MRSKPIIFIYAKLIMRIRPPFTIQRICELILSPPGAPFSNYGSLDKYLFALERACYISSESTDPKINGANNQMEIDKM